MASEPRTILLTSRVPARAAGTALVEFLAARFRYHTREEWRERIADGRVTLDGSRAAPEAELHAGSVVGYARPAVEPDAPEHVRIVHDAGGVVVVDKPAGLPFHADGAFLTRTVVGVLARTLGARLRPVQRLDRETSGLCVLARDRATARALHEQLAARSVEKTYEALVRGTLEPDEIVVDATIGRDPTSEIAIRRAVVPVDAPGAEPAVTEITVVARSGRACHVRCRPRTGRTHQIRVHLESLGTPIVGDKLYGRSDREYLEWLGWVKAGGDAAFGGRFDAPRQMLHARSVAFQDPSSDRRLSFTVDPPDDFRRCARELDIAGTTA